MWLSGKRCMFVCSWSKSVPLIFISVVCFFSNSSDFLKIIFYFKCVPKLIKYAFKMTSHKEHQPLFRRLFYLLTTLFWKKFFLYMVISHSKRGFTSRSYGQSPSCTRQIMSPHSIHVHVASYRQDMADLSSSVFQFLTCLESFSGHSLYMLYR